MLSSKQKTAIIIAGVIVVGIFIFYMATKTRTYDYSVINEAIEDTKEDKSDEIEETVNEIIIHITGAVENEGIVKLEEGSRIADAIEIAGGLTSEADITSINLAYMLKDGQKIYIPKISDTEEEIAGIEEPKIDIIIDNGGYGNTSTKININTATISELVTLSGIGEGTAIKIIDYREKNGQFKSIEDIKNVSGIGDAKYESIKDYICVK